MQTALKNYIAYLLQTVLEITSMPTYVLYQMKLIKGANKRKLGTSAVTKKEAATLCYIDDKIWCFSKTRSKVIK